MSSAVVRYREYPPCAALRDCVRAFFSFALPTRDVSPFRATVREVLFDAGDSFCSPLFADSHCSIVFSFPRVCHADGVWRTCSAAPRADVIGPMSRVGDASLDERPEMLGVYLHASAGARCEGVAAAELIDRIVPLEDLWGRVACALAADLSGIDEEPARIAHLESALLACIGRSQAPGSTLDIPGLTAFVLRRGGQVTVERLADIAGTSRQHLTRVFRQTVGVSPKLFCGLARLHATLPYARYAGHVPWAQIAAGMGYADQSHMIAEFRQPDAGNARERALVPPVSRSSPARMLLMGTRRILRWRQSRPRGIGIDYWLFCRFLTFL
jgi:AraC-like DNA-binding protein